MKYSISRNGQIIGSYTEEEVRGYIQQGRIVGTDYALPEGGQQWIPVSQLSFAAAAAPAATEASPAAAAANTPVSTTTGQTQPKSNLVIAIVSTVLGVLGCNLFTSPFALGFGITAIVFATQVERKFTGGDHAGAARASKNAAIFGWIAFGFGLVGFVMMAVFFSIGFFGALGRR